MSTIVITIALSCAENPPFSMSMNIRKWYLGVGSLCIEGNIKLCHEHGHVLAYLLVDLPELLDYLDGSNDCSIPEVLVQPCQRYLP